MSEQTTTKRYWWNLNSGHCVCDKHAGAYLTAGIERRPKAQSHNTPLGKWAVMPEADRAELTELYGEVCDTCKREGDK